MNCAFPLNHKMIGFPLYYMWWLFIHNADLVVIIINMINKVGSHLEIWRGKVR